MNSSRLDNRPDFRKSRADCAYRLGRRRPVCAFHATAGLALLGLLVIYSVTSDLTPLVPLTMTLALVGKTAISASFAIILLYTREVVPTSIR